ncbi:alpha/beta fold hydrolase [Nocardiopsis sp. NPDC058631]|uniref:alpha/beta fold hydrolase n=1 Tax=Nocardiopsis sp. NPDC058631 TaxID=3346566 RepID=UPI0036652DD9
MTVNRHPRSRGLAIAVLPAVLVLSACAAPTPDGAEADSAGLDRFYQQELDFGSCSDYATTQLEAETYEVLTPAECARLEVPIDYEQPGGETAQLAVMRLGAGGEAIGSLVVNPGGPGGSGLMQTVNAAVGLDGTAIPEQFDIIGFDPRGVGASTPAVDCVSDEQADEGGNIFPQAAIQGTYGAEDIERVTDACIEGTGSESLLANVGTRDAARDMDILRSALGDEQLSYMGQSYGTRLGAVYAEMFPENVRAMVLDGAVDPTLGTAERRLTQYAGFQRAFDAMATSCAAEADCVLGDDPDQASQRFQEIVRPLIDTPATTGVGRDVDFNLAVGAVIAGLYTPSDWPQVLAGITELEQGRGDTLLELSDVFSQRGADGVWANYLEANFAVNCMDEERRTPEEEESLRAEIFEAAPFMDPGEGAKGARDGCEAWPTEPDLGYPYAEDVEGLPETLTISITDDPSTPYEGGAALAETLGGALLTVEGEQHTIAMSGASECVNDAVAAYLVDLESPPENAGCAL